MALLFANTSLGVVKGLRAGNNNISVFKGIPYAKPPVGNLRFHAPVPAGSWDGIYEAYDYGPAPLQPARKKGTFYQKLFFPVDVENSEDCLYLNIWTPADNKDANLPVAVWIYGGGFTTGYSHKIEFDGEAFAKRGCIFVSINYRVGIPGFLAHPELSAESETGTSGNYGLMDQILAIRWVKENIAAFGGNPNLITIFGQSAGAMSCMYLSYSPETKDLFQRVIMESCAGPNLSVERSMLTLKEAEELGERTLREMGYTSIEEIRAADEDELLMNIEQVVGNKLMQFTPIIDGYLLPSTVQDALDDNRHHKLDYLYGSVSNEGYGFRVGTTYDPSEFERESRKLYGNSADAYLQALHFTPNGSKAPTDQFGDLMLAGNLYWNELELRRGGSTAYQYYFTRTLPGEESGAFHSCEHAYIFQTLNRFDLPYQGRDFELSNIMCDYWCNFIKTGDPNGKGLPVWKKYSSEQHKLLEIGDEVRMIPVPHIPGVAFTLAHMTTKGTV